MLVLLSGVSGAGKDTIKKELIKRMENVESLPSFTDRAPRIGEVEGQIYHFVETEEFERMIEAGELYEYDVHHERYYGTSKKLKNDVKVITIFLRVPKEELRKRLENRIDKPSPKEIMLRLNRFDYEESKIDLYDYVIKNNNLEKTVNIIMTIINQEYNIGETEF